MYPVIEEIEAMDSQAVFDYAVRHLLTQARKARVGAVCGPCAYRGHDGTACAVGCFIPDALYSPTMEGQYVCGLWEKMSPQVLEYRVFKAFLERHMRLLRVLQEVHDMREPNEWFSYLFSVGRAFGFSLTVFYEFPPVVHERSTAPRLPSTNTWGQASPSTWSLLLGHSAALAPAPAKDTYHECEEPETA